MFPPWPSTAEWPHPFPLEDDSRRLIAELKAPEPHYACARALRDGTEVRPMRTKLLNDNGGQRTFAIIMQVGDEAVACLQEFVKAQRVTAAQFSGIGALSGGTLNYFDWEKKAYQPIPVREQVEVASLIGDVALSPKGDAALHIHAVLGRRDGAALAGHLSEAHVRPTLEIVLTESPTYLQKVMDPESGLALIKP
jgi:uncharacterized protein